MRSLKRLFVSTCAVFACACGSNPVAPPPPTIDPPKITCPSAPQPVTSPTGLAIPVSYGSPTVALGKAPVTTACAPESGTSFPVGSTTVTCTATDALQRTDTCTFSVTVTAPPRISLTRFVAFGDSITWGEDGQFFSTSSLSLGPIRPAVQVATPYPAALQVLLTAQYSSQSIQVQNAGCRGEMLEYNVNPPDCAGGLQAAARFSNVIGGGTYQAVLLMEGANDLAEELAQYPSTAAADAAISALRTMIETAKSRNVRPYLATLTPENPNGTTPARRGGAANYVPPFNKRLSDLAASEGITLVDVYSAISSVAGWETTLIGPDGLHPTQQGYNVIAQTFFTSLKSTLQATTSPTMTLSAPASLRGRTGSSATPAAAGPGSRPGVRRPR